MATSPESSAAQRSSSAAPGPASLLDTVTATVAATKAIKAGGAGPAIQPEPAGNAASAAVVTVVLTTGGDLDCLERSLDALTRQDLAAAYEVIVVHADPEPDPGAARMVAAWSARNGAAAERASGGHGVVDHGFVDPVFVDHVSVGHAAAQGAGRPHQHGERLRYLPNTAQADGLAAARNLGWRSASAPLIAFIDEGSVPARDWLRQGLAALSSASSRATLDELANDIADELANASADAKAAAAPHHRQADAARGRVDCVLPKFPTEGQLREQQRATAAWAGMNWFCRRGVLERLGGFDERYADAASIDADMHFRLLDGGVRLLRAPAAVVSCPLPPTGWADSLTRLHFLASDALLYKNHRQRYRDTVRRPPDWHDIAVTAALLAAASGIWLGWELLAVSAGGTWLVLTAMLCIRRLRDTAKTPSHIAAVLLTSLVLPPLALCWRLAGAFRHRVLYA